MTDAPAEPPPEQPSEQPPSEPASFGGLVSRSAGMREVLELARRVAPTKSNVLILGETGVGKERLARAIHAESARRDGPFVVLNCGAVPESLLESELFGHEEGAFTGASRTRRGHVELADRGTLFLDEIGEMPLSSQVKLLRVLQDREIVRLGSEATRPVDVRILAATNRELAEETKEKRFRADLFYRLSVVSIVLPPLRERREDIPLLVAQYLERFAGEVGTSVQGITSGAMQAMRSYDWPGNVRELMNVCERAVLLCSGEVDVTDLPDEMLSVPRVELEAPLPRSANDIEEWTDLPLADARRAWLADCERRYLAALLRDTGGRIGQTAKRAGIDPRSLYTKMRQYGLRKEDFKRPE